MTSEFDFDSAAARIKKRDTERHLEREALFKKAVENCKEIVEMIKTEFTPSRIYQWGSLLRPDQFDENSDIDIAVEGLGTAEKFFSMYGKALEIARFKLDIIELEKIDQIDRESIIKRGKLVYERS